MALRRDDRLLALLSVVTGLYNYYREAYPDAHPFYKPFALLFPRGDRQKGLTDLELAARNALFLKAEAYAFLSEIHLGYENNYLAAEHYSKRLAEQYPGNNEFLALHVRNLLLLKKYGEAEALLARAKQPQSRWFQAEKAFFPAILREKKYRQPAEAEALYRSALQKPELSLQRPEPGNVVRVSIERNHNCTTSGNWQQSSDEYQDQNLGDDNPQEHGERVYGGIGDRGLVVVGNGSGIGEGRGVSGTSGQESDE